MRLHNCFVYCAYVIGSWLCIGLPMTINGSGLGRCPKYPSMPRFNLGRVSAYNLMSLLFTVVILHFAPLLILNLKELASLKYHTEFKLVGKRWVSTYIFCYSTDRYTYLSTFDNFPWCMDSRIMPFLPSCNKTVNYHMQENKPTINPNKPCRLRAGAQVGGAVADTTQSLWNLIQRLPINTHPRNLCAMQASSHKATD